MRVSWPRASCLTGLLLVAGGWVLTVFLSILIIDHQQQRVVRETLVLDEARQAPCDCPCAKSSSPVDSPTPEAVLNMRDTHPTLGAVRDTGNSHPHPHPAPRVRLENGAMRLESFPIRRLVGEHHVDTAYNLTYWRMLKEYQDRISAFIAKKSTNNIQTNLSNGVPLYFVQPGSRDRIWPIPNETDDRVLAQVNLVPNVGESPIKIALLGKFPEIFMGDKQFVKDECPIQKCDIVGNYIHADVIVFKRESINSVAKNLKPNQTVVWYTLESPENSPILPRDVINWTATYRMDSTINTPYEKFTLYRNHSSALVPNKNYAAGKTKMAAWFVSNCRTQNGRAEYVKELQRYISVDVYGTCGPLRCPRRSKQCEKMLARDYKFYLAFENSNCVNYVTEKFFWNGLLNDVVPVVFGARPEDYAAVAPPHSYIHVDDFASPRDLADYLLKLNTDHQKYNEYFRWKGSGEFLNTKFWCRLCALAHEATATDTRLYYRDFQKWWAGDGVCLKADNKTGWATWRDKPRSYGYMDQDTLQYVG